MSMPGPDHDRGEREAHEWEVQERGRRQAADADAAWNAPAVTGIVRGASSGIDAAASPSIAADAVAADAYRRIAQALRRPPPVDLPPDFAVRMARMAETLAQAPAPTAVPAAAADPLLERVLLRALVAAFALGAVVVGFVYGARLFTQLQAAIGAQGVQWVALLAGCLGLSWSLDRLRALAGHSFRHRRPA